VPEPGHLSATSVLLYLRGSRHPDPNAVYRIDLADQVWTVHTVDARLRVEPGAPTTPDASLHTDPATLNELLADPGILTSVIAAGRASVTGDEKALLRLLT
jgi:hypothetical protein